MPDDGIVTLAEAFASAESELGSAGSDEGEAPLPGVEPDDAGAANTAEVGAADNPEEAGAEDSTVDLEGFEDLFTPEEGDGKSVDPGSPEFLQTTVTFDTVEGPETLTIEELQKGYMRTADYTRKTQAAAAQSRAASDAVDFFKSFQENPAEFARSMAVRAGLIEEGASPVKDIELARIPTPESIEEMVEQRLQERLKADPTVQQARLAAAREHVRSTFEGIESDFSVSLTKEQRQAVVAEANKRGTTDLRLTFEAMLGRLRSEQSRRNAAPARPSGSPAAAEQESAEKVPKTVEEAFKMATAELAGA